MQKRENLFIFIQFFLLFVVVNKITMYTHLQSGESSGCINLYTTITRKFKFQTGKLVIKKIENKMIKNNK